MQANIKAKAKLQILKSITYLSNILPSTSECRSIIQKNIEDMTTDRIQTIYQTILDPQAYKNFIACEHNRDKKNPQAYRSPYTNKYFSFTNCAFDSLDSTFPSPILRDLQQKGNILFQQYSRLYYGEQSCIGNFFVNQSEDGLNVMFYLKKQYDDEQMKGVWCSTNLFQIRGDPVKSVTYKLQTTVLYELNIKLDGNEKNFANFSGILKKNKVQAKKLSKEYQIDQFHLMVCGKLVQENQTLLRQQLESIFAAKSSQIASKCRYQFTREQQQRRKELSRQYVKLRAQTQKIVE